MKIPLPVVFALGTALCWGLYGPVLGNARSPEHSPFKPYVGIGLAYVFWAIMGGLGGMKLNSDSFNFAVPATVWGFAAGSLGAGGALCLTTAMFKGGVAMPHVVMPVVFGGAVTVAAIASMIISGNASQASPLLWVGIVGIVVCIVLVASNTPHAGSAHKKTAHAASSISPAGDEEPQQPAP